MEISMANVISDETIEYVGILAKLELSDEEKEAAKKDMGRMLDYIDKLSELDTTGVEPMSHVFPVQNVFREDVVTNGDESEQTLANAPGEKDNMFVVPRTNVKSLGLSIRNRVEYRFIIWLQHLGGNGFPSDIKKGEWIWIFYP